MMLDKGAVKPCASFEMKSHESAKVWLKADEGFHANAANYKSFRNVDDARDYIASIASKKVTIMRTYLGKLADAVDYGHANGIAAEYVDPVRITQKAMSDNLLASE